MTVDDRFQVTEWKDSTGCTRGASEYRCKTCGVEIDSHEGRAWHNDFHNKLEGALGLDAFTGLFRKLFEG